MCQPERSIPARPTYKSARPLLFKAKDWAFVAVPRQEPADRWAGWSGSAVARQAGGRASRRGIATRETAQPGLGSASHRATQAHGSIWSSVLTDRLQACRLQACRLQACRRSEGRLQACRWSENRPIQRVRGRASAPIADPRADWSVCRPNATPDDGIGGRTASSGPRSSPGGPGRSVYRPPGPGAAPRGARRGRRSTRPRKPPLAGPGEEGAPPGPTDPAQALGCLRGPNSSADDKAHLSYTQHRKTNAVPCRQKGA